MTTEETTGVKEAQETPETGSQEPQKTPDGGEKKGDVTVALKKEREEKKAMKEKLAEYEAKLSEYDKEKEKARKKEMEKKGQYEELSKERETKEKELEELRTFRESYNEKRKSELDSKIESIPEEKRELVSKLIDGKSVDEQIDIISEMSDVFKKPDFKANPKTNGSATPEGNEYAKAKAN